MLIGVGAVVSGILVPTLTRGAQNHREALEVKSELVSSMSAAASPFLAATLANVLVHDGNAPPSYDSAYEQWVASSNNVWTKLRTYLPDDEATDAWSSFMLRMRDLYYFFRFTPAEGGGTRAEYTRRLSAYVGAVGAKDGVQFAVNFARIDRWLAAPRRRFDGEINFYTEELFFALRTAMVQIQSMTLQATPHL